MSEYYIDYISTLRIITIYPALSYIGYLFCKKYYKYILNYNLLVLDMYDNTDNYINTNNIILHSNKSTQTDNYFILEQ